MSTENLKFARKCNATSEGMNEGWVINLHYYKYQEGADAHAQTIPNDENPELGNYINFEELYNSFGDEDDNDFCYWTTWEEDFQYEMIDGVLTEIEEKTDLPLKFVGIDSWNQPIFKSEKGGYYGTNDVLFSHHATASQVIHDLKVKKTKLWYFGKSFNCEPNGGDIKDEFNVILTK